MAIWILFQTAQQLKAGINIYIEIAVIDLEAKSSPASNRMDIGFWSISKEHF
jgi:hypothetical protein